MPLLPRLLLFTISILFLTSPTHGSDQLAVDTGLFIGVVPGYVEAISYDEAQLRKRAPVPALALFNNQPQSKDILPGESQYWSISRQVLTGPRGQLGVGLPGQYDDDDTNDDDVTKIELRKRQTQTPLYVTLNTCMQPGGSSDSDPPPPQLQLWLSIAAANTNPGPTTQAESVRFAVEGGYGIVNITATDNVYVGVSAPNSTVYSTSYNYQIAASIDQPFHYWDDISNEVLFVDGDTHAALLHTSDLTDEDSTSDVYKQWMSLSPPYGMFAFPHANQSLLGLSRSYCGLYHGTIISNNIPGILNPNTAAMTNRYPGGMPKQQFYMQNLESATAYYGFLVESGNTTAQGQGVIGGGGTVYAAMNFSTKASSNCALVYNLTFCSDVAYAVPTNPELFPPSTGLQNLSNVYDDYASSMYRYFSYALQQIPCNISSTGQYSLARNCDDCAAAYKTWLCATTIPRCEDWSNTADYLQPRALAQNFTNGTAPPWLSDISLPENSLLNYTAYNSSRNSIIDTQIQPGPYREVLPCDFLCYNLVQSCPAAMSFSCPRGKYMNLSYGSRSADSGVISCSFPGAAYYESSSTRTSAKSSTIAALWTATLSVMLLVAL